MKIHVLRRAYSACLYRQARIEELTELQDLENEIDSLIQKLHSKKQRIAAMRKEARALQYEAVEEPTKCKAKRESSYRKPRISKTKRELLEHFKGDAQLLELISKL